MLRLDDALRGPPRGNFTILIIRFKMFEDDFECGPHIRQQKKENKRGATRDVTKRVSVVAGKV